MGKNTSKYKMLDITVIQICTLCVIWKNTFYRNASLWIHEWTLNLLLKCDCVWNWFLG